jgi:hypothetical protein
VKEQINRSKNKVESPKLDPQKHGQVILDKEIFNNRTEKRKVFPINDR